jgi:hypothetical protein
MPTARSAALKLEPFDRHRFHRDNFIQSMPEPSPAAAVSDLTKSEIGPATVTRRSKFARTGLSASSSPMPLRRKLKKDLLRRFLILLKSHKTLRFEH